MIRKMSHTTIYVLDQERAKKFYTEKLGFKVVNDASMPEMGGLRWLTVSPPEQPDLEIILMAIRPGPALDEESCASLRRLVEKGLMGAGVFATNDCKKTYEELSAKGVKFQSPPSERPYGIEAVLEDDSGNWFSMTQRRA
jgi:catechol 2,3-dioxygenase-like lactoylglutathione lyase family enzyme